MVKGLSKRKTARQGLTDPLPCNRIVSASASGQRPRKLKTNMAAHAHPDIDVMSVCFGREVNSKCVLSRDRRPQKVSTTRGAERKVLSVAGGEVVDRDYGDPVTKITAAACT